MPDRPRIGVGVYIRKEGTVLFGKRLGSHGKGGWLAPGGHLEFGESWESCAAREAEEEAGLIVRNIAFMTATNDIFLDNGKHYVTLHMVADWESGEPETREPEKIGEWQWFAWESLPVPLFLSAENLVKTGVNPLEFKG